MEKGLSIIFIGAVLFFFIVPALGQDYGTEFYQETIKDFNVDIDINKDGSFSVIENIVYDFDKNSRHGIYRDIPLEGIKIKVLTVTDELDNTYLFTVSRQGSYLRVKIGDPDKLITGKHNYSILYSVIRGIGYFEDHDELYWDVTGNEWETPIENSSAIVHLPEKIPNKDLQFDCYTGPLYSKEKDCTVNVEDNGDIYFKGERSFSTGEGLTIVLGWPKGVIEEPTILQKILWWLMEFWPIFIPILVFIFLFREWWHRGKDPEIEKTIIAQYEPPNSLRPAEVNLVINQEVKSKDVSATLIDLAVRGYIKIREIKKSGIFGKDDYELIKLKEFNGEDLHDYERRLLKSIFGMSDKMKISGLENKFYSKLPIITKKIYPGISNYKYFTSNPQKVRKKWLAIGGTIIALGIFSFIFLSSLSGSLSVFSISVLISGIFFIVFGPFMPKRTKKGTEAYWHALGFKEYINTAEKHRVEFQEKENIFERYLPYAMIFGLAEKWAKAFEGIYTNPPSWYEGAYGPRFTTYAFVNSLDRSMSSVNSAFVSRPGGKGSGFGGGGSSGGGGGGGGGGSW